MTTLTRPRPAVLDWAVRTAHCPACGASLMGPAWAVGRWRAEHVRDCPRSLVEGAR